MRKRVFFPVFTLLAFHFLSVVAAFAQIPIGGPSAPPSASANPDIHTTAEQNKFALQHGAADYLQGNVSVKGGAFPWDPIPVTVTCQGKARYATNADAKGKFLIAPSNVPGSAPVKDEKPFALQFIGCVVEAVLPGFDSSTLTIASRSVGNDPNIGTITLHREEGSGGIALPSTTAAAPKDAMKAFEKARSEWLDQKTDRALRDLQKAVDLYPQFAEAWYQLGKMQEASNSPEAGNSFSKAVAADPQFAPPYEHLVPLAVLAKKWQEVVDYTSRVLELNPRGTPRLWYYSALANFKLNKVDAAQAAAVKGLSVDPLHTVPNTEQLLAVILASKQDFAGAVEHLRNCLTYFPPGPNLELVKQQIVEFEPAVPAAK